VSRFNRRFWHRRGLRWHHRIRDGSAGELTLNNLHPGDLVCLKRFAPGIARSRLARLQAYGLIPGCRVQVLQVWPVIVVQVEHTELALENELAGQILVDED
jgi:Fe2+ transport system protein FeoA